MFPAFPTGMQWNSGASPSRSTISKAPGLLALDAERVHRIHDDDRRAARQLPHDLEGNVEIAPHLQDLRPVHECLGQLAERDVALGDEHRALIPARAA